MLNAYMNEQDVPSAKEAEAFVTVGEQRYNLLNAKNFEWQSLTMIGSIKSFSG